MKPPARVLADLFICGKAIVRLPFRLRVLWLITSLSLIAVLGVVAGRAQPQGAPSLTGPVVKVVDGDTIRVRLGNREEVVRCIGMNAPEVHHPTKGKQPGGPEAAAMNRRPVEGRTVRLELDVQERNRYGRLLAYVYAGNLMVNAEMVRLGFAQVMSPFTP